MNDEKLRVAVANFVAGFRMPTVSDTASFGIVRLCAGMTTRTPLLFCAK
jgi:hypothetical protein